MQSTLRRQLLHVSTATALSLSATPWQPLITLVSLCLLLYQSTSKHTIASRNRLALVPRLAPTSCHSSTTRFSPIGAQKFLTKHSHCCLLLLLRSVTPTVTNISTAALVRPYFLPCSSREAFQCLTYKRPQGRNVGGWLGRLRKKTRLKGKERKNSNKEEERKKR